MRSNLEVVASFIFNVSSQHKTRKSTCDIPAMNINFNLACVDHKFTGWQPNWNWKIDIVLSFFYSVQIILRFSLVDMWKVSDEKQKSGTISKRGITSGMELSCSSIRTDFDPRVPSTLPDQSFHLHLNLLPQMSMEFQSKRCTQLIHD